MRLPLLCIYLNIKFAFCLNLMINFEMVRRNTEECSECSGGLGEAVLNSLFMFRFENAAAS